MTGPPELGEEWADLLERRPALRPSLGIYGEIVEIWAGLGCELPGLPWDEAVARASWGGHVPLIVARPPVLRREDVEQVLEPLVHALSGLSPRLADGLERFAAAWDHGDIGPEALLPRQGSIGSVPESIWFDPPAVAFVSLVGLAPFLRAWLADYASRAPGSPDWPLGVCPCCGAPPGFSEVAEDGQRGLACHYCACRWTFPRLRCPYCGEGEASKLLQLQPERADAGYSVWACLGCRGYLKELDRRVRWNGRSALVEDWGTPHLDLVASRAGYWRPVASLVQLARGPSTEAPPE